MIKVEKKNQQEFTVKVEEKEFNLRVISKYFPEFEEEIRTYRSAWEPLSNYVPEDEVTKIQACIY